MFNNICFITELFYRECVLVSKTDVTHDTQVLRLQLPPGSHLQVPVGRHVYLKTSLQGNASLYVSQHMLCWSKENRWKVTVLCDGVQQAFFLCLVSTAGTDVVKPYTPVDQTLIPPSQSSAEVGSDLHLMIKIYPDGLLTSHLAKLPIGL